MQSIVEVHTLVKTFTANKNTSGQHDGVSLIHALNNFDLDVSPGEIFGLIGPDGAGKTTFLRILSGLLFPTSGDVKVFGKRLPENIETVRDSLGYMSQKFALYPDLTVNENLAFFAEIYGVDENELEKRVAGLYEMTRLAEFKDRLAGKLSGGMKQKLALMCTLMPHPRLLLLDEPTTGVDPISRREFWEILQSLLSDGVTIIVSTPYMDEAEWCTQIGLLHEGKLLACASPRELKKNLGHVILEGYLPDSSAAAVKKISASDGIVDMHKLGGRIRVTMRDQKSSKSLIHQLAPMMQLLESAPSIEDVFLKQVRNAHAN